MIRQNLFFVSNFSGLITMTICRNTYTETNSEIFDGNKPKAEKVNIIIDIKLTKGETLSEVEKVLGKAASTENVKCYPCKNNKCQKAFFKNGDTEIIFKLDKADRITISSVPNLTNNDNALEALGMKASKPSVKNPNKIIRWQDTENINEISFFTD